MSGMLTRILTTILFHSRGPEVRRPAGESGRGGDTRRLLRVSQPSCRPGCQASRERRAGRCAGSGQTCRSRCPLGRPGPAAGLSRLLLPLSGPRRLLPSAEARPLPSSCPEGGTRAAAAAFCGRISSRALKSVAQTGVSPRAARAFPSARGRRYFQRRRVSGLDATSSV